MKNKKSPGVETSMLIVLLIALIFQGNYILATSFRKAGEKVSVNVDSQNCTQRDSVTMENEDQISNLKKYFKTPESANKMKDTFYGNFKHGTQNNNVDTTATEINMSAIVDLYSEHLKNPHCASFISGVRIIYAMEGNKIKYFFQPVYMCRSAGRWYDVVDTFTVYQYQVAQTGKGKKAEFVPATNPKKYINNYLDNIRIFNKKKNVFRKHNKIDNVEGDSRSIIFSFQELFKLYHDSYPEKGKDRYCNNVLLYNGAINYKRLRKISILPKWRIKHTLLIEAQNHDGSLAPSKSANLAHLCPPGCVQLNYKAH